jgi:hypothetical protein
MDTPVKAFLAHKVTLFEWGEHSRADLAASSDGLVPLAQLSVSRTLVRRALISIHKDLLVGLSSEETRNGLFAL